MYMRLSRRAGRAASVTLTVVTAAGVAYALSRFLGRRTEQRKRQEAAEARPASTPKTGEEPGGSNEPTQIRTPSPALRRRPSHTPPEGVPCTPPVKAAINGSTGTGPGPADAASLEGQPTVDEDETRARPPVSLAIATSSMLVVMVAWLWTNGFEEWRAAPCFHWGYALVLFLAVDALRVWC